MPSSFEGLKNWADKAIQYVKANSVQYNGLSGKDQLEAMYDIYAKDQPFTKEDELEAKKQMELFNKMVETEGKNEKLSMFPQSMRKYGIDSIEAYKNKLIETLDKRKKSLESALESAEKLSPDIRKRIEAEIQNLNTKIQNPPNPLNEFAYFMERKDIKDKIQEDGASRLTLTFKPGKAGEVFEKLAAYLSDDKNAGKWKYIKQAKVMGPSGQGTRTDSAVIYLSTSNPDIAKAIAEDIKKKVDIGESNWVDHTPFGMQGMSGSGIIYSQRDPRQSSHGLARSAIIKAVVDEYQKTGDKTKFDVKKTLKKVLKRNGYNENKPHLLDFNSYKEMLKKKILDANAFDVPKILKSEFAKMKKSFGNFDQDIVRREIMNHYDAMYDADGSDFAVEPDDFTDDLNKLDAAEEDIDLFDFVDDFDDGYDGDIEDNASDSSDGSEADSDAQKKKKKKKRKTK